MGVVGKIQQQTYEVQQAVFMVTSPIFSHVYLNTHYEVLVYRTELLTRQTSMTTL